MRKVFQWFYENGFLILVIFCVSFFVSTAMQSLKTQGELTERIIQLGNRLSLVEDDRSTESFLDAFMSLEIKRQVEINKIYSKMHNKDLTKADYVSRAAREYDIDPILLTVLINSESGFKEDVKHNNPDVKGMGGIHTKYWSIPNGTVEEQIYATAFVFSHLMDKYDGDIIKALKAYKGWSDLGEKRAKKVYEKYQEHLEREK